MFLVPGQSEPNERCMPDLRQPGMFGDRAAVAADGSAIQLVKETPSHASRVQFERWNCAFAMSLAGRGGAMGVRARVG